jgi:tetratricopeptide (TPR) repeat protein
VAWLPDELAFDRLGMGVTTPSVVARTWLAFSRAETGAFAEALAQGAEALRIAEALDHPYGLYHGHLAVGAVHALKGDGALAVPALERELRIAKESSMLGMGRPTVAHLGSAYGLIGRVDAATAVLEDGLLVNPSNVFLTINVCALAQAYLLGGRIVEAEQAATRALELSRRQEQRGNEARAMWVRSELAARSVPAEAESLYRSALALADTLGMRPLIAQCHLGLGKLYRRASKTEQAQEHLTTATAMLREMGMRFYLEQAETELRELG